ncbi:hypothetical protein [Nonomuraea sp. NPDC003804]|uniref:hypothetical protein n=1 Tax=Nonomuraea sp. NPDC003804 TaxID=3154547 RepID=UPI0033BCADDA
MIERADQLVLDYVSKAADAAHGVLRQDQRLDFVKRLRARIEAERGGSADPKAVARVLARFGDPVALVEREARRLSGAADAPRIQAAPQVRPAGLQDQAGLQGQAGSWERAAGQAGPEVRPAGKDTVVFPRIVDDVPPGVARFRRQARRRPAGKAGRGLPFAGSRRATGAGGGDAGTLVKEHPREVLGMGLLVLAALLVPFGLPAIAIFQVPAIVWAAGAVAVLVSDNLSFKDRMIGLGAPIFGYAVGGVVIGALRAGGTGGFNAFLEQFFAVSGTMFMIFAGLGVVWLAVRLLGVS